MSKQEQSLLEYFIIKDDFAAESTWFLDEPRIESAQQLDVWAFTAGRRLTFDSGLLVAIQKCGNMADITFSHYDIPYIQPRVGRILEAFAGWDIQCIPARLETGEEIEILNVLTVLDAFDYERSEATYKQGKPHMVMKLRIQSERAEGHHIFRLKTWRGPLIISSLILEHLRRMGATGFISTRVS